MTRSYKKFKVRINVIIATTILSWFCLSIRLFQIQILNGAEYKSAVLLQSQRKHVSMPERGNFFDRDNRPLSRNVFHYTLFANPKQINDRFGLAKEISGITNKPIDIYLENYIPVYGISFNINIDQLSGVGLENISFQNGQGGRAEESGWTVGLNNSGFVVALSQGNGNPIQPGEGVFTQIEWNIEDLPQVSGLINISDLEVSGYFGSELSFEIGPSRIVEENLALSDIKNIPEYYVLHNAYPNPFNPLTTINYDLPKNSFVRIDIYDLMGRQIKTLVNENMKAGYRSIHWNATDDLSKPVSAGLYIYTIQAGEFMKTKKMVLIK